MSGLTHFDADGRARMVDVGGKPETERLALAEGAVRLPQQAFDEVREGRSRKGDVARVAELAGIMAAKRTSELIPLCHPLPLSSVKVSVASDPTLPGFRVTAEAKTTGRTGVEMEALTAVSTACLAIYDMLKALTHDMTIEGIALVEKRGGKSGLWQRS